MSKIKDEMKGFVKKTIKNAVDTIITEDNIYPTTEIDKSELEKTNKTSGRFADAASKIIKGTVVASSGSAIAGTLLTKILIGTALVAILGTAGGFLIHDAFKTPTIADTKNIVEHIRTISELTTANYYEEFVVHKTKIVEKKHLFSFFQKDQEPDSVQNELVLIIKGSARAGFDLSSLNENDIIAQSDTIIIQLPAPKLFDVIVNPSDYEIYVEEGDWSHNEIQTFNAETKVLLEQNALKEDILGRAKSEGIERLTNIFKTFGYSVVQLNVKE